MRRATPAAGKASIPEEPPRFEPHPAHKTSAFATQGTEAASGDAECRSRTGAPLQRIARKAGDRLKDSYTRSASGTVNNPGGMPGRTPTAIGSLTTNGTPTIHTRRITASAPHRPVPSGTQGPIPVVSDTGGPPLRISCIIQGPIKGRDGRQTRRSASCDQSLQVRTSRARVTEREAVAVRVAS